ncbi:MAG: 50S ribosomal protein L11 methyltransferase, partial [Deltaproteobacteria bacterium]
MSPFELCVSGEAPRRAAWLTEADDPAPRALLPVDDRLTADRAFSLIRGGKQLLYRGNWKNARQLHAALGRRLSKGRRAPPRSPLETFRAERAQRAREHELLGRLHVELGPSFELRLPDAPDVRDACALAWGPPPGIPTLLSLPLLLGALGAAEWTRKGLSVPGLPMSLRPRYGVYSPTRNEYVELLRQAPAPKGRRLFDVGTGTGVLAFVLLERGAQSAVGTDVEPRAVACANDNAARLGLGERYRAEERDLFPDGRADLVVCNPPWLPEPPRTRLDRAVFDPDGDLLRRLLAGLKDHLEPDGEAWLLLGDLAVLLGLRPPDWLSQALRENGLQTRFRLDGRPSHGRARDEADPLHEARSREVTTLYA